MKLWVVLVIFAACYYQASEAAPEVSEVTRRIHGSYGPFRDFARTDCDQPIESKWTKCPGTSPIFAYHWNHKLKGCERAIYKGCGATRNSFVTERDCQNQAASICAK
ncbi:uncharacterized protein LOC143190714 [Rhynchophorus ferrugineus]|uniref:BPTI/Kunitz inhibitor domain-containing protein n=2 Tax=Rhynchophorus ferrugineus TaxID=354439 RepID=A0A834HQ81_RHYFE|nr:hypothetical protein GWI33_021102 [Rhynchophorus ferrugineus]